MAKDDFSDLAEMVDDFPATKIGIPSQNAKEGHYDDAGEYVTGTQGEYTYVNEPLVPASQQAKFDYQAGGMVQLYDATWYSHHNELEVGDQIKDVDDNIFYQIANKTAYGAFTNVIEYGLKAVKK